MLCLPYFYKKHFNLPDNYIYFHMSGAYHLYEMIYGPKYFAKFSDDCYKTVYDRCYKNIKEQKRDQNEIKQTARHM